MKIAAVCCTYLRPQLLGAAIDCFLRQTYDNRKLVILDDAGQYEPQGGDRWELRSTAARYPTLGAKRNALAGIALEDPTVDAIAVMDDDDYYFPHWLSVIAEALAAAPWCAAQTVYVDRGDGLLTRQATVNSVGHTFFHGTWAFLRSCFTAAGGYSNALSMGEDIELQTRLIPIFGRAGDSTALASPYYIYRPCYAPVTSYQISKMHPAQGYDLLGDEWRPDKTELRIGPLANFAGRRVSEDILPCTWGTSGYVFPPRQ